jgi:pyruvate dehydrogenase (quinone)
VVRLVTPGTLTEERLLDSRRNNFLAAAARLRADGEHMAIAWADISTGEFQVVETSLGDAAATLRALLPLLEPTTDRSWRERIEVNVEKWWRTMDQEAKVDADPVNPMRVVSELSDRLPSNAVVTADSGSAANWYARQLRFTDGVRGSLSGTLATMGCGVPYAIGAKFGLPDRPAIALVGDGAMQMNGLAELITVARYWQDWEDPRLVVAVLHNNDLNQVTWEMRAMAGAPKLPDSQTLPDVSYADFAARIGLEAHTVDEPDQVGPAWESALAADRPTLIDVRVDPDIPPIPPHATFDQILDTAKAMLKGDEDRWDVMRKGVRTKAQEFLR